MTSIIMDRGGFKRNYHKHKNNQKHHHDDYTRKQTDMEGECIGEYKRFENFEIRHNGYS